MKPLQDNCFQKLLGLLVMIPLMCPSVLAESTQQGKRLEKDLTQMTQDMKKLEHDMSRLNQKMDEANWSMYQASYSLMGLTHAMSQHCPNNLNRQELEVWRAYLKALKVSGSKINGLESFYQAEYQKSLKSNLVKENPLVCDSPKFAQYRVSSQKQIHFLKSEISKLSR